MVNMTIIYTACVAGAAALLIALPKRGSKLALLGSLIAAAALGAAFLALTPTITKNTITSSTPGPFFYILAFIAAGAALRMITNPRPVYAALYFILVVLATAGLFILLSADFMAFALIIVYAGAILITYLFVIMLAHEVPDEDDLSSLTEYDANAREPFAASVTGFLLLAVLLSITYRGITPAESPWTQEDSQNNQLLAQTDPALAFMPIKVQQSLRDAELIPQDATVSNVDTENRVATYTTTDGHEKIAKLPDDLHPANVETIGLSLFNDFPVTLELAGIILFMAMLGAVVLARKPHSPP